MAAWRCLATCEVDLLARWRRAYRLSPSPSARALFALQQLLLPRPDVPEALNEAAYWERIAYVAARLARLGVGMEQIQAGLAAFRPLVVSCLAREFGRVRAEALHAAIRQRTVLAVAEAFVAERSRAAGALLAVLDAELNSADLSELLLHLLEHAAQLFPFRWGEILLTEEGADPGAARGPASGNEPALRHAALWGLEPGMIREALPSGPFFQRILRRGQPGFLLDAANDPRVAQPYFRSLDVKSVWAMPLARRFPAASGGEASVPPEVLGILVLAFDRVYECLPQEMELLRALAERSTLAIERTRMHERIARQQRRVLELSRRLLAAQDEERRRISRDLHDETGQALLALRNYLEMALRAGAGGDAAAVRSWLQRGLALVDQSVAELRRLLAQLSPLVLDELGLEPALRLELRRLRARHGWRQVRFLYRALPGRLDRGLEILIYRVVIEGLRNIGRHASATRVGVRIDVSPERVALRLADNGVGLRPPARGIPAQSGHFGLSGMRERIRLAGGVMRVRPNPAAGGSGLLLLIQIPVPRSAAAPAPRSAAGAARAS